jgi:Protein of unknown function (DUF3011)
VRKVTIAIACLLPVTWGAAVPRAASPASPAPPSGGSERTLVCESKNYHYRYCRIDTENRATLQRQISAFSPCTYGDTWGYDARGVWVDRGCEGEFRVGRESGGNKAAVAGAVAVGAILAAAIAANKSHHDDPVESWAVGTFRGYDESEGTDVEVTIMPGGSVTGSAGDASFSGRWDRNQLQLGQFRFTVERSGNGFRAVDQRNSSHRVQFRRISGGY